jgi:hypothetical protein
VTVDDIEQLLQDKSKKIVEEVMWLVTRNLSVLGLRIPWVAVPLSVLEAFVAA